MAYTVSQLCKVASFPVISRSRICLLARSALLLCTHSCSRSGGNCRRSCKARNRFYLQLIKPGIIFLRFHKKQRHVTEKKLKHNLRFVSITSMALTLKRPGGQLNQPPPSTFRTIISQKLIFAHRAFMTFFIQVLRNFWHYFCKKLVNITVIYTDYQYFNNSRWKNNKIHKLQKQRNT